MKAFSEDLRKYHFIDLIRTGPDADMDGDDWDYCVTCCSLDGDTCFLIGLHSDGKFSEAHKDAILDQARALGYRTAKWRRKRKSGEGFRTVTVRL